MNLFAPLLRFLPLLLMGLLTLGTYWMVQLTNPDDNYIQPKRHIPDYIMDQIVVTTLGPDGAAKYRVVGDKLTHYEDDATSEIDFPIARRFNPNKPATTIRSDKGFMDGDLTTIELVGNATLTRPAQTATSSQPGSARMFMSSSRFTILMNDDIVKTNQPVTLEQGLSVMTARDGAIFDNVHQKLIMNGQVRGRIESEKNRSTQ